MCDDRQEYGSRPVVIVSNNTGNIHSRIVTVVPCETKEKRLPTITNIVAKRECYAHAENIQTVAKDSLKEYVRTLTDDEMHRVENCILTALGIDFFEDEGKNGEIKLEADDDLKEMLEQALRERDEYKRRWHDALDENVSVTASKGVNFDVEK